MRETENEINLLLPGGGEIFHPLYDTPEWSFGAATDGVEGPSLSNSRLHPIPARQVGAVSQEAERAGAACLPRQTEVRRRQAVHQDFEAGPPWV